MLAWLAPAWLLAAAVVALPLVLHLWSRGQARRVQVGSVSWLRPAEGLRGRRFRPSDPILLAVRASFWVLLALALALPRWRADATTASAVDWVLLAPGVAAEVSRGHRATELEAAIEAFSARGGRRVERRLLAAGFPRAGSRLDGAGSPEPFWSWLVEADEAAAPGASFLVVTPLRLAGLGGERPRLGRRVEIVAWDPSAPAPSVAPAVPAARSRPLEIVWLGDWRSEGEERRYLRAGLEAGSAALGLRLDPLEREEDAAARGVRVAGTITLEFDAPAPDRSGASCREPLVLLARSIEHTFGRSRCADVVPGAASAPVAGEVRGRDAFGRPWMTALPAPSGELWRSTLGPRLAASDLAASAAWPALVADLVESAARAAAILPSSARDERRVDPRQAKPASATDGAGAPTPIDGGASWPELGAWLGVAVLAATERRVAARRDRG